LVPMSPVVSWSRGPHTTCLTADDILTAIGRCWPSAGGCPHKYAPGIPCRFPGRVIGARLWSFAHRCQDIFHRPVRHNLATIQPNRPRTPVPHDS
jgi:hypothetical protein